MRESQDRTTETKERRNNTGEPVVSAPLEVKRGQIHSQFKGEFEEPFSQFIMHHVILRVQLGLTTHQPPQDWV